MNETVVKNLADLNIAPTFNFLIRNWRLLQSIFVKLKMGAKVQTA